MGSDRKCGPRHLQAPFRSGITIEDYQLDPVVRALRMPRVNLLVADDVGLGKTIEAGVVVQELLLRHRARSILVVCPASLTVVMRLMKDILPPRPEYPRKFDLLRDSALLVATLPRSRSS
jgi:SNF2 family DNA or RNA helicase